MSAPVMLANNKAINEANGNTEQAALEGEQIESIDELLSKAVENATFDSADGGYVLNLFLFDKDGNEIKDEDEAERADEKAAEPHNTAQVVKYGEALDVAQALFENKTKPQDSVAGKLMRQTHYNNSNNNKIEFVGNKDTFTTVDSFHDPITNKNYSDATQYALETNGFYSDLDFVAQEDDYGNVKPVSNLNPFGPAGLRFNIDVENVTSIPKGKLEESPEKMMRTIAYNSNMEFKQVFDVIDYVDQELAKRSNNVTETHTGLNTDPNKSKRVMSVSYKKTNTGLHFDFGYTDLVLENLYKDDKINNPILGLLHERIHKTILLAVENSKFSDDVIEDAKIKLERDKM